MMDSSSYREALQPLVGLPMFGFGCASNMLWLQFGKMREVSVPKVGTKSVGEWAIHVQCSWRLSCKGSILVASRDYYRTPDGGLIRNDLENPEKSKFDEVAKVINAGSPAIVASIACDDMGGFALYFDDESRFEVFPDSSTPGEHWRLFQPGIAKKHFVVKPVLDGQVEGAFE